MGETEELVRITAEIKEEDTERADQESCHEETQSGEVAKESEQCLPSLITEHLKEDIQERPTIQTEKDLQTEEYLPHHVKIRESKAKEEIIYDTEKEFSLGLIQISTLPLNHNAKEIDEEVLVKTENNR